MYAFFYILSSSTFSFEYEIIFSSYLTTKQMFNCTKTVSFFLGKKIWFIILDRVEIKIFKYKWQLFQAVLQLFKVDNFVWRELLKFANY